MRQQARNTAWFYISKVSGFKDYTREELTEALLTNNILLPQIIRQGVPLAGTRLY
jgi:hypothetical protein